MNNLNQTTSPLKKDLGDVWLVVIGFILIVVQFFITLFFWPFTYLTAFLLGVISLMRSIKKKKTGLIVASIVLMILPVVLIFVIRAINS